MHSRMLFLCTHSSMQGQHAAHSTHVCVQLSGVPRSPQHACASVGDPTPTTCRRRRPQASDATRELPRLQAAYGELQQRYAAAVELVGERDEQLEELAADLADVKALFRRQLEELLGQLAAATSGGGALGAP